jgi:hypothetical protein
VSLSATELCIVVATLVGLAKPALALIGLLGGRMERPPVEPLFMERLSRSDPPALPEHVGGYRTSPSEPR